MTTHRTRLLALPLLALASAAGAQQVDLSLDDTLTLGETEVAYRLDLGLSAVAPTRVRVDALLDLRDFQERLPELLAGEPVSDGCGNTTVLEEITVTARDSVVGVSGTLNTRFFHCGRTSDTGFERGELKSELDLGFTGEVTTRIADDCIVFNIVEMDLRPLKHITEGTEDSENLAAARTLLREAVNLVLADRPLCFDLPPELAPLAPSYDTVGPREIGDGGLGISVSGSVDVSTRTILSILSVLQREGAIPGPP
ncbi:hypothetical protein [Tropicimonas isoalkanivorans]|uniref:Uncharacterized protein n=1 Tax=Tropicimonas isoalkanivorans TaxID=441112 RepID=A0A1I1KVI4_9RHOB|nr:hypothetical protein [Tropicimonas isoalkanivorans]SFC62133.1 hypothetical protein SAMN04488094_10712 [Tropicimonas isoalkanivorans]